MASFLVFRDLPGVTRDQYTAAQHAAAEAAGRTSAAGRQVSYRGGFYLPATAQAICVFDADTAADVAAVNQLAGVPVTDIVEAIDLHTPPRQISAQADATSPGEQRHDKPPADRRLLPPPRGAGCAPASCPSRSPRAARTYAGGASEVVCVAIMRVAAVSCKLG